ncbi:hypothetical protein [Endozoicomonas sp. ALB032]|uniref:hypothetical protein n=1 Tax=Endozoicomonas sp. ALB032 TaxID=3403082 RepID=UPI003BB60490
MEFTESGLSFHFEDDRCYRIENAQGAIGVGEGIKKAEFLYIDAGNNLWVLEEVKQDIHITAFHHPYHERVKQDIQEE